jgi:spore maturation protein SpmA
VLNYIWIGLVLAAVLLGGATGQLKEVTTAAFEGCKTAVMTIALPLAGVMTLWLGIMKIGEKAGAIDFIAKIIAPFFQ